MKKGFAIILAVMLALGVVALWQGSAEEIFADPQLIDPQDPNVDGNIRTHGTGGYLLMDPLVTETAYTATSFRFDLTYEVPASVQAGDFTFIELCGPLLQGYGEAEITDGATTLAHLTFADKLLTVTYTDAFSNGYKEISFEFFADLDWQNAIDGETYDVGLKFNNEEPEILGRIQYEYALEFDDEALNKHFQGLVSADASGVVMGYRIRINASGCELGAVLLADEIKKAGPSYVKDSVKIWKVKFTWDPVEKTYQFDANKNSWIDVTNQFQADIIFAESTEGLPVFGIWLGNLEETDQYIIEYNLRADFADKVSFVNQAELMSFGEIFLGQVTLFNDYIKPEGGEKESADFRIHKVDEKGLPLEGASFMLRSLDDSQSEFEPYVTNESTDENGEILFEGLEIRDYELIETSPPEGYELDDQVNRWIIEAKALKSDEILVKRIVNKKKAAPPTTSVQEKDEESVPATGIKTRFAVAGAFFLSLAALLLVFGQRKVEEK
ncbi:MAG TPA: prealbumin-like fold domain-containing protein [Bacillota bacterium]|nr:hypothetical protein [Fastidiosipila sp.]HPX93857.1 prealbumin-like fold domain-containing protein [Bacillota bacterium]HQB81722.1 prealbumin-like fold domain-containing protein [Bacillota bacterium]